MSEVDPPIVPALTSSSESEEDPDDVNADNFLSREFAALSKKRKLARSAVAAEATDKKKSKPCPASSSSGVATTVASKKKVAGVIRKKPVAARSSAPTLNDEDNMSEKSGMSDGEEELSGGVDDLRNAVSTRLEEEDMPVDIDPFDNILMGIELRANSTQGDTRSEVAKMFSDVLIDPDLGTQVIISNLFAMICCIISDTIYTKSGVLSSQELEALYRQKFFETMKTMLLSSYVEDNLFSDANDFFGPKGSAREWPPIFLEYVDDCLALPLNKTAASRKRRKNMTDLEAKNFMFAELIKSTAEECRQEINNRVTPLWRPPHKLASGETPAGLLDAIRCHHFRD